MELISVSELKWLDLSNEINKEGLSKERVAVLEGPPLLSTLELIKGLRGS
jgi:hypothetical protein